MGLIKSLQRILGVYYIQSIRVETINGSVKITSVQFKCLSNAANNSRNDESVKIHFSTV